MSNKGQDDRRKAVVDLGLKAEVSIDITEPVKNLVGGPSEIIGNLFSAFLYFPTRKIANLYKNKLDEDNFEREKRKLQQVAELNAIKHYKLIPQERLKDPNHSEIIPPIEALNVYFDKQYYREMISKLIASTFDSSKNVHPCYINIIQQLAEFELKLLHLMKKSYKLDSFDQASTFGGENILAVKLVLIQNDSFEIIGEMSSTNSYYINPEYFDSLDNITPEEFELGMDLAILNLERLGLIKIEKPNNFFVYSESEMARYHTNTPREIYKSDSFSFIKNITAVKPVELSQEEKEIRDSFTIGNDPYPISLDYSGIVFTMSPTTLGRSFCNCCI